MEIKHTVEILTKDIQDIEKLVRNFNNSPAPPIIELDLALSKLRNVYDLLSMIKADVEAANISEERPEEKAVEKAPEAVSEQAIEPQAEQVIEQIPEPVPESVVESVAEPVADPVAKTDSVTAPENETEEAAEPVEHKQAVQTEIPMENQEQPKKKEAEILAEKFSNDPSINENIASTTNNEDVTSKITGQPIDNIGRNIGINDRFLIIRELFEGDNDNYSLLIQELDSTANEQEAINLLEMRFPDASEHEGYQLLSQLARRKFISG